MKVLWFYVFDFHPDSSRKQPIGAWITKDGNLDYVFDPDYPEDEEIPSDLINRMLDAGEKTISQDAFEYWRSHLGYYRSASQIHNEIVVDYTHFVTKLSSEIGAA